MASLAAVAAAQTADFGQVVREHQSMVFSIAYHFLQDRALAEEIAQDAFLRLYSNWEELESPEHVKAWLRRTASNLCIDFCRRRKFMPRVGLDSIPEPSSPPSGGDPMLTRTLSQLVASLPENWRALIILRYQEDMELEEIAGALDMRPTAVKSQLARALEFLREKATRVLGDRQ
jgi:RNA polymerase sigma-70 factor, ECF subfamily